MFFQIHSWRFLYSPRIRLNPLSNIYIYIYDHTYIRANCFASCPLRTNFINNIVRTFITAPCMSRRLHELRLSFVSPPRRCEIINTASASSTFFRTLSTMTIVWILCFFFFFFEFVEDNNSWDKYVGSKTKNYKQTRIKLILILFKFVGNLITKQPSLRYLHYFVKWESLKLLTCQIRGFEFKLFLKQLHVGFSILCFSWHCKIMILCKNNNNN